MFGRRLVFSSLLLEQLIWNRYGPCLGADFSCYIHDHAWKISIIFLGLLVDIDILICLDHYNKDEGIAVCTCPLTCTPYKGTQLLGVHDFEIKHF
jgi:hypothetical protein